MKTFINLLDSKLKHKSRLILLGLVLIVLMLSAFALNYSLGKETGVLDNFSLQFLADLPDNLTLKNVFISEYNKFSIEYPEGWSVVKNEQEFANHVTFLSRSPSDPEMQFRISNNDAKIQIVILENSDFKDLATWVNDFVAQDPFSFNQVESFRKIDISGQESLLQVIDTFDADYFVVYVPYENKVFVINGPGETNRYYSVFLHMLASLKFRD